MKQRRVLLTAGIVLVLLFAWQLAAQAAFPAVVSAPKTGDFSGKTVILHSNNVHGELDGYAAMAALRQSFLNQGAEVITIDLGDFSQGGAYVGVNQGQDVITLMNAASICQFINGGIVGRGLSTRKIGMAMRKLGFEHTHTRAGEFYKVYLIPPNDIQPSLAIPEDEQSVNETDTKAPEEGDFPF